MFDNFRYQSQNRWHNSRKKHHRHKMLHNDIICEHFECISSLKEPEIANRLAYIIKPPPLFKLTAPPNPLEFIDHHDPNLFRQLLDISCKRSNVNKPSIKYNITKYFEDYDGVNESYKYERRPFKFFNQYLDLANSTNAVDKTTPSVSISSTSSGNDSNMLNWFLLFGMALLTVILLFVIFYVFLKRRKNGTISRKSHSDISSDQVHSSTMSQSSYASDHNQSNSLIQNYQTEKISINTNQTQLEQFQHLLNRESYEFSQYIPNNQINVQPIPNNHLDFLKTLNNVARSQSNTAYDCMSMPKKCELMNSNQIHREYRPGSKKYSPIKNTNSSFKSNMSTKNNKLFIKNSAFNVDKKIKNDNKPTKHLPLQVEACGCSTLSTRAPTESSSSTSPSSTRTNSTKSTTVMNSTLQNCHHDTNHYQKLFNNNNTSCNKSNVMTQYEKALCNYSTNLNSSYVPNKVALLCNTDTSMPQLIKIMDITELNEYVQLLNQDAKTRQIGVEHYENFCTPSNNVISPLLFPAPSEEAETDEVYELIDDMAPYNQIDNSINTSSNASTSLLKRKYPKTNLTNSNASKT